MSYQKNLKGRLNVNKKCIQTRKSTYIFQYKQKKDLISNKIADKITKVPKPSTRQHKVFHIQLKVKKKT